MRRSLSTAREAHPGCIRKPCRGLRTHPASTQYPHKAWHGPPLTCSCTPADTHNPTPLPLAPPHAPSQPVPVSQIRMAREQQDEPEEDRKHEYPKEYPGVKSSLLYQLPSTTQSLSSPVRSIARSGARRRHPHLRSILRSYGTQDACAPWIFWCPEQAT